MLTKKQKDLLIYIHERMLDPDGVAPSFDEMKDRLGLKSKSGIHRLITGLVERGYLRRLPNRARALEVVKLPDSYGAAETGKPRGINPLSQTAPSFSLDIIPMHGKIAAGTPIEALEGNGDSLQLPSGFAGYGEHYGLTVEGDSMIKAGIHDNDIVIIRRADTARNGDIVVALVDDHEATLKRFEQSGPMITLFPENDDYEPQVLEAQRVKIQGHLVSLMRRYH